jgi:cytochrome b6-f complex iron-sulfur subunit
VGETIAITGGGKPIAVTRTSATTVVAVSRICTHQGCTVNLPRTQLGNLNCPCHGSAFTVSGSVVNGPATAPLQSFPARIEGNEVVVTVS